MPSSIFNSLIDEKISTFKRSYCETSKQTFLNNEGKLIHPGEYGKYREACCKDFLRYFVPQRLEIEEGFIINTHDEVSTECDIIIYDKNNTPLIQSQEMQKFYPVETVASVGEIKSVLTKKQFKTALEKLAKVKSLKKQQVESKKIKKTIDGKFNPKFNPKDNIFTFLICERFNFDLSELAVTINNIYSNDICASTRHNLILSIQDGVAAYYSEKENGIPLFIPYPMFNQQPVKASVIPPIESDGHNHIKIFANYVYMGTSSATLINPDITSYLMTKFSEAEYAV